MFVNMLVKMPVLRLTLLLRKMRLAATKQKFDSARVLRTYSISRTTSGVIADERDELRKPQSRNLIVVFPSEGLGRHPNKIGNSTPRPKTRNQSAGAGVPTGRTRRCSRMAMRGSSNSQRV
jgi:hypothetical protein